MPGSKLAERHAGCLVCFQFDTTHRQQADREQQRNEEAVVPERRGLKARKHRLVKHLKTKDVKAQSQEAQSALSFIS